MSNRTNLEFDKFSNFSYYYNEYCMDFANNQGRKFIEPFA